MRGRIEVICGCMSSGKTAELIRRLARLEQQGRRVAAVKHAVDVRYSPHEIVSRTGSRRAACVVADSESILAAAAPFNVVGIDETQFFGHTLAEVVDRLASTGRQVVASGLDIDAWKQPFPPIPDIARFADEVSVLNAACAVCGRAAGFTQRTAPLTEDDRRVGRTRLVGAGEIFEPRCGAHFVPLTS